MPDWQALREAGKQIRQHTMAHLDFYLQEFERNCTAAGGVVHWARDAAEARQIIVGLVKATGSDEVIKIKSMTTEEIQLNPALAAAGIHPYETDLAELIIQLGHDQPSHIVVPALHKNRQQIREIFSPRDEPAGTRRGAAGPWPMRHGDFCAKKFLRVKTGVSGANFLIAETGGVCRRRERRQRTHVPDAAGDAHHRLQGSTRLSRATGILKCCCRCCRALRPASG